MKNGEQQIKKEKRTENNKRVLKRHVGNIKGIGLNMIFFFFEHKGALRHWGPKTLDTMLKDSNNYIEDIVNIKVENILKYKDKLRVVGKVQKSIFWDNNSAKKYHWC